MRWILNAFLVSLCGLAASGSVLVAQTPEKTQQPTPSANEERPKAEDEQTPKEDDDRPRRAPEGERRVRGPGGPQGPFGGPGGPGPRMMMARLPLMMALDADRDGEISSSEIEGAVAALKKLDKNSDGKLTMEELVPEGMPGPFGPGGPGGPGSFDPEEMIKRMMMADANGDGFIDQDEMPERMKTMMLDRADTDKDGKLSKDEITKMVSQMGGRRGPGGAGPRGERERSDTEREESDEPKRPRRPRSE